MNKVLSAISQTQIASKKEQIFKSFKWNILHDESLKEELKKEIISFSEILSKKFKIAESKNQDYLSQKYHVFFTKLVKYSQCFNNQERLEDTKVIVEIFSQFIDLTNNEQSYKGEGFEAKTVIQEKLFSLGAVQMVLDMMCSKDNQLIDDVFPYLLRFANKVLDGAQNNIQAFFTDYLTKNQDSINLFERCYHLIEKDIKALQKTSQELEDEILQQFDGKRDKNQSDKKPKAYNKQINVQKQILKFFKNLCENHNTKMQLQIGNQQHPEKNFDLVSLTANYLHSLISNITTSKRNYSNAQHCCISLAEYVQGPCFVNQSLIKDANFYHIAIQILSFKPNLMQDLQGMLDTDLIKSQNTTMNQNTQSSLKKKNTQLQKLSTLSGYNIFIQDEKHKTDDKQQNGFSLTNFMIQKLKLNRSSDDPLLLSMKRTIPLEIIKQNITYEYFLFCKDYNKFLSRENFFRHVLTQKDEEIKEELIIEVGFNLYFLLKRWNEHKITNDSQLEEVMNLVYTQQSKFDSWTTTAKRFLYLIKNIATNIKHLIKKFRKRNRTIDDRHKQSRIESFIAERTNLTEALQFFKNNSAQIDVLVKNNIEKVYFPYMPYCTYLSEEEKRDFYNALPTDRDKEKIEVLVTTSTDLIRRMKIEYKFKKFFIDYPLIGPFVYYTELWKSLAFYTIIILNFMNLYSFTAANGNDRLFAPIFFGLTIDQTDYLYQFIGILQILLAIFIDTTILSKRVIYHYQLIFVDKKEENGTEESHNLDQFQQEQQDWQNKIKFIKKIIEYMMSALQDFQLLYYTGYLIFSFFGYIFHPFFYAYHMIDMIIRNPYLKNVLKAVYRPRYELINTFVLFICMQYIFAMLAYAFFYEDFNNNECSSLSQCFLVIIDQTFKNDGGLGNFLERPYPKNMDQGGSINIKRFFYDNFFNVILVILVVEIISGIIIDTFGALREEHNKITDSIENKCMICGKNRDQIEREYQDSQTADDEKSINKNADEKAFEFHKREKHNIYDYIFFLAYLQEKPELEYTGLESYVFEKYEEENNTWFPIYKTGCDKLKQNYSSKNQDESNDDDDSEKDSDSQNDNSNDDDEYKLDRNMNQRQIVDCLMNMNSKIDFISDSLGLLQEDQEEEIETRQSFKFARKNSTRGGNTNEFRRKNSGVQVQGSGNQPNINIGNFGGQNLSAPTRFGGFVRQNSNSANKKLSVRIKI